MIEDLGSIPACTGKPLPYLLPPEEGEVYPRMYGETIASCDADRWRRGLSPHVRGNQRIALPYCIMYRSIPACTGKPPRNVSAATPSEVYPRMYGETRYNRSPISSRPGLSPHVRGNRRPGVQHFPGGGSIPACTGKPPTHGLFWVPGAVYPRMYGETLLHLLQPARYLGLSPHVRGNRAPAGSCPTGLGSIPACTGKPVGGRPAWRARRVYPRMYGETELLGLRADIKKGLSPHVRGNLRPIAPIPSSSRSIPACTGKPCPRHTLSLALGSIPACTGKPTG